MGDMSRHLTDLEITRLCAEAMGFSYAPFKDDASAQFWLNYYPLHDDAQLLALGKSNPALFLCAVQVWDRERVMGREADLNRIVCTAFAKMQQAKTCPAT